MAVLKGKASKKIGKAGVAFVLILICAAFLLFVGLDAQASKIQYEINQINKEIADVEKDITKLEVQIKSATNITILEKRALELGMIYPSFDQIIYVNGASEIEEFALALMESVY